MNAPSRFNITLALDKTHNPFSYCLKDGLGSFVSRSVWISGLRNIEVGLEVRP